MKFDVLRQEIIRHALNTTEHTGHRYVSVLTIPGSNVFVIEVRVDGMFKIYDFYEENDIFKIRYNNKMTCNYRHDGFVLGYCGCYTRLSEIMRYGINYIK